MTLNSMAFRILYFLVLFGTAAAPRILELSLHTFKFHSPGNGATLRLFVSFDFKLNEKYK